LYKPTLKNSKK